jgi:predicted DNA-binding helix-hairpin-helix protein
MDLYQKISILGPGAQYDTCGPRDFGQTTNIPGVYHAKIGSATCRLFKVLQSNYCQNNCFYCAFRRDRNCTRAQASADEMAAAFSSAHQRRLVDGLFLSSGIITNPETTMTKMLDTLTILRQKYHYRGYIHLKIMPGSSGSTIREAAKLSNRISLNMESPNETGLAHLSPEKNLKIGFFQTLFEIKKQIRQLQFYGLKTPSLTTQFVVGANTDSDLDLIKTTNLLYSSFGLKRVFFSAFRPIPNTPLENLPASSLTRQHRLYQSDFLMRFYRFSPQDLPLDQNGNLFESTDPKTLWANLHPNAFPINLNFANYYQLLKIPGLGPVTATKIVKNRRLSPITLSNLSSLKLPQKSLSYIKT